MTNDQTQLSNPANMRVAIVGPIWQQNVLSLWLQAVGQVTSVTCTTDVSSLGFCLEQDLVILATMDNSTNQSTIKSSTESSTESLDTQIQTIQQHWPMARLLILADESNEQIRMCQNEPNVFLLTKALPKQVIAMLGQLLEQNSR
ncbi:MAG: hypothetical protein AAF639_15700 [Chloroflexota bacterium]